MTSLEYVSHDALGLAGLIARKEVGPQEVVDAAMGQIRALNPRINAVVETLFESVEEQLRTMDWSAPFAGVPYLIKDLHTLVEGSLLTQGSRFLAGHRSQVDSDLVARLRKAGFVILGRTNTPEFGLNATTEPRLHGPTRNPWDITRSPGGSSGGAAAAVAVGMVPAAHATDSGGSTRIPASVCGLVGLKPSRGRNFAGLDHGEGWSDLFHAHAVTRSLRDSAAILDATANNNAPAPYRAPNVEPLVGALSRRPQSLRIGVLATPPSGGLVAPEYLEALDRVAAGCAELGHSVESFSFQWDGARYARAFTLVLSSSVAATVAAHEASLGLVAREGDFEPVVWQAIELARRSSAADLNRAIADLHLLSGSVVTGMGHLDALLTPTVAGPAWPLGSLSTDRTDLEGFFAEVFRYAPFTSLWNGAGLPAMSLPLEWTREGMPLGFQVIAKAGREDVLFQLGNQLQERFPWQERQRALVEKWARTPH